MRAQSGNETVRAGPPRAQTRGASDLNVIDYPSAAEARAGRETPARRRSNRDLAAGDGTRSMDEIDRKLLVLLQEDATASVAELAARVGLSSTPCWQRMQKLAADGVITRRVALLDPARIGISVNVFVMVEAYDHTPGWLQEFVVAVSAMPEVMEFYRMAGDAEYMMRVAVADLAAYDAFYKRLIATVPLKKVTARFAAEPLKHTTAYPLAAARFRDTRGRG